MVVKCDTSIDKEGKMMIVEKYACDKCGKSMDEPWSEVSTHGDIFWGYPASVHLCKECSGEFTRWLKNKPSIDLDKTTYGELMKVREAASKLEEEKTPSEKLMEHYAETLKLLGGDE